MNVPPQRMKRLDGERNNAKNKISCMQCLRKRSSFTVDETVKYIVLICSRVTYISFFDHKHRKRVLRLVIIKPLGLPVMTRSSTQFLVLC